MRSESMEGCSVCATYSDQSMEQHEIEQLSDQIEQFLALRSQYAGVVGGEADYHEKHNFLEDLEKIENQTDCQILEIMDIRPDKGYNSSKQLERVIQHSDRITQTDGKTLQGLLEEDNSSGGETFVSAFRNGFKDNLLSHAFLRYEDRGKEVNIAPEIRETAEEIFLQRDFYA